MATRAVGRETARAKVWSRRDGEAARRNELNA